MACVLVVAWVLEAVPDVVRVLDVVELTLGHDDVFELRLPVGVSGRLIVAESCQCLLPIWSRVVCTHYNYKLVYEYPSEGKTTGTAGERN